MNITTRRYASVTDLSRTYYLVLVLSWSLALLDDALSKITPYHRGNGAVDSESHGSVSDCSETNSRVLMLG